MEAVRTLDNLLGPCPSEKPSEFEVRGVFFIVEPNRNILTELAALADRHVLKPAVSDILPLERAGEAFERGAGGHPRGKLILKVRDCVSKEVS
jgi:NADPH:quinone reductase-like Zn-dependent oxidoreductase